MFGYIIWISLFIVTALILIFIFCSCILASRSDKLADEMFDKRKVKY